MADNGPDYSDVIEIFKKNEGNGAERRKKRDWIARLPNIIALASGLMVLAVWILWSLANPARTGTDWGWLSFFRAFDAPPAQPWSRVMVNIAYILLLVSIGLCVIALACNKLRMRRKTDKYSWAVFFVGGLAIVTFIVFLVKFIPMNIIGYW